MIDLFKYSKKSIFYEKLIKFFFKVDFEKLSKPFYISDNVDLKFDSNFFYEYKKNYPSTKWMGDGQHYQSNHDLQSFSEIKPIIKNLEDVINKNVKKTFLDKNCSGKFSIKSLWFTIQKENEGHSEHMHPKSLLTGVYYFQVDENSGGLININLESKKIKHEPKKHDLLIFNSNLMHSVDKYYGKNDRIAVAWDAIYTF